MKKFARKCANRTFRAFSLAVVRNGKVIKATGYGLANVELNVPVTPQMVFNPGSLAKAFTATVARD